MFTLVRYAIYKKISIIGYNTVKVSIASVRYIYNILGFGGLTDEFTLANFELRGGTAVDIVESASK